jgi:hypothetical protein
MRVTLKKASYAIVPARAVSMISLQEQRLRNSLIKAEPGPV